MHSLWGVPAVLIAVVVAAVIFDYVNGFHDTANAIATVVSTRALTPRAAILMAAVLNFAGALVSQRVAKTIGSDLVAPTDATQMMILSAIVGAIIWNLITWRFGIPSSSSHALIGGLCGAAIVHGLAIHRGLGIVNWANVVEKVILPLIAAPIVGFMLGFAIMGAIFLTLARERPGKVSAVFQRLQMLSAASVAFNHGQNDAQKSMGIITMALVVLHPIPAGGSGPSIELWVILVCAAAMALGTSAGGYRIMKTMGHRIIRLEPVNGFAAEAAASITIFLGSLFGMPLSTTHVISGSIFGVGASRRLSAVRWGVAQSMVIAWILTIPMAGMMAAGSYMALAKLGLR